MNAAHVKEESERKGAKSHSIKKLEVSSHRSALRPLHNTTTSSKFTIYTDPSSKSSKPVKSLVSVATNTESTIDQHSVQVQTTISHAEYGSESSPSFLLNRVDFEVLAGERRERIEELEELNASLDMRNAELLLDKSDLEEQLASKQAENEELLEAVQSAQSLVDAIKPILDDDESNDEEEHSEGDNTEADTSAL